MLPFYGVAHVACVAGPSGHALQLGEVEALVAMYSKRLHVQVQTLDPQALVKTPASLLLESHELF